MYVCTSACVCAYDSCDLFVGKNEEKKSFELCVCALAGVNVRTSACVRAHMCVCLCCVCVYMIICDLLG